MEKGPGTPDPFSGSLISAACLRCPAGRSRPDNRSRYPAARTCCLVGPVGAAAGRIAGPIGADFDVSVVDSSGQADCSGWSCRSPWRVVQPLGGTRASPHRSGETPGFPRFLGSLLPFTQGLTSLVSRLQHTDAQLIPAELASRIAAENNENREGMYPFRAQGKWPASQDARPEGT